MSHVAFAMSWPNLWIISCFHQGGTNMASVALEATLSPNQSQKKSVSLPHSAASKRYQWLLDSHPVSCLMNGVGVLVVLQFNESQKTIIGMSLTKHLFEGVSYPPVSFEGGHCLEQESVVHFSFPHWCFSVPWKAAHNSKGDCLDSKRISQNKPKTKGNLHKVEKKLEKMFSFSEMKEMEKRNRKMKRQVLFWGWKSWPRKPKDSEGKPPWPESEIQRRKTKVHAKEISDDQPKTALRKERNTKKVSSVLWKRIQN